MVCSLDPGGGLGRSSGLGFREDIGKLAPDSFTGRSSPFVSPKEEEEKYLLRRLKRKGPVISPFRKPKHGKSPLSAVARGIEGVKFLVPVGLSYYPTTHQKHLSVLSEPQTRQERSS